jgi:hypothetical protein
MHARLDTGRTQILTRRGNDWTEKYPEIAKAIGQLPARNAYLDGELCGVLPDGRTAFNLIQNATDTAQGSLVFPFRPAASGRGESDCVATGRAQDPAGITAAWCAEFAAI